MGYSEDTVRVHWGTLRVQLGSVGYSEGTGRIQ